MQLLRELPGPDPRQAWPSVPLFRHVCWACCPLPAAPLLLQPFTQTHVDQFRQALLASLHLPASFTESKINITITMPPLVRRAARLASGWSSWAGLGGSRGARLCTQRSFGKLPRPFKVRSTWN